MKKLFFHFQKDMFLTSVVKLKGDLANLLLFLPHSQRRRRRHSSTLQSGHLTNLPAEFNNFGIFKGFGKVKYGFNLVFVQLILVLVF
jgi:hypothetical protein